MSLRTLTILQATYAFLAIGYLLLSFWHLQATGEALSAAAARVREIMGVAAAGVQEGALC
jgi:hypothetical protein